jgi:hypothetical protein
VGKTVAAAAAISGVVQVIVVDDGSRDATSLEADEAGAEVIRLKRNRGKGAALRKGLKIAIGDLVLFLDADLGESAALAEALIGPVSRREAGMTIADFVPAIGEPPTGSERNGVKYPPRDQNQREGAQLNGKPVQTKGGGFGLLVGLARWGLRILTGLKLNSPLSGQRCLHRALAEDVGIANRFGVEVSLTLEVFRRNAKIQEIPLPMTHAVTGRTAAGFKHRGRQFADALGAMLAAAYGIGWPKISRERMTIRLMLWLAAIVGLLMTAAYFTADFTVSVGINLAAALALVIPLYALFSVEHWFRPNYIGFKIPTSFGLLIALSWLIGWKFRIETPPLDTVGAMLVLTWAFLGLLDDMAPSGGARGFHGHVRAISTLRLTTGSAKLIIGGGISFLAAWLAFGEGWFSIILNGLLIALCTNFFNLLDLRPGRTIKALFVLAVVAWWLNTETAPLLAPMLAAAIVLAPMDLGGRVMLGDIGSNMLGAIAGLALAFSLGLPAKIIFVLLLIIIHIYSEMASLSQLIERVPPLRWLDRLGRAGN